MYEVTVTPEFLLIIIAGLLALAFDYFPGVAKWFDALSESHKKLLNVGLLLATALVMYGGQCFGWFVTNLTCSSKGLFDMLYIVFLALGVNYSIHKATKPSEAIKARMFG